MIKSGKEKKNFRDQIELATAIEVVRREFNEFSSHPLKNMSRSIYVRSELAQHGAIQANDDKGLAGMMVEPAVFNSMLEYINLLEDQLEIANLDTMLEHRKGNEGFLCGNSLAREAFSLLTDNKEEIQRFLNDDK